MKGLKYSDSLKLFLITSKEMEVKKFVTVYTKEEGMLQFSAEEFMRFILRRSHTYHRLDGPAMEFSDGTEQWYLDGKKYTKSRHNKIVEKAKREIKNMPVELKLTDPRWWIRELK